MGSIEEALRTAGAEDDLQTILLVLEDKSGGFKRHEAAAGPFANMDTMLLTGLNTCLAPSRGRSSSSSNIKVGLSALDVCVTLSTLCTYTSAVDTSSHHPPCTVLCNYNAKALQAVKTCSQDELDSMHHASTQHLAMFRHACPSALCMAGFAGLDSQLVVCLMQSLLAASCCWRAIPSLLLLRSANASS